MNSCINSKTNIDQIIASKILLVMILAWVLTLANYTLCFADNVILSWDANTESTLAGYKVYYKADVATMPFDGIGAVEGASPIDVHNQTSAVVSGLDPSKTYYFAITAYNTSGVESAYSSIVTILESLAPTTAVSSPSNNAAVSGTVSVTATASDNVGVTKVEFYVNGVLVATDTATPYVYSWNTSSLVSGTYILMTKAYDAAGNVGQSSNVTVTVVNDTTAPVVAFTAPVINSTVAGTVVVTASASDDVGVSNVEFYLNNNLIFATNVSPYTYNWNTTSVTNGVYTLTAKAYDNAGHVGQSSETVTVLNDITAPTINIGVRKANGGSSGVLTVTATANDDVGVSRVNFYVNGTLASTVTSAPYVYYWDSTAVVSGSYTLVARAYDAAGNFGESGTVKLSRPYVQFR